MFNSSSMTIHALHDASESKKRSLKRPEVWEWDSVRNLSWTSYKSTSMNSKSKHLNIESSMHINPATRISVVLLIKFSNEASSNSLNFGYHIKLHQNFSLLCSFWTSCTVLSNSFLTIFDKIAEDITTDAIVMLIMYKQA